MFNTTQEAESFGVELINRMRAKVDEVSSLKLKEQILDGTIKNFETLVSEEERTIERCYKELPVISQSKHFTESDRVANHKLIEVSKAKLDIWHSFIDEVNQIKSKVEYLLKGWQQFNKNLVSELTENLIEDYKQDLKYYPADEMELLNERHRIIKEAVEAKQLVFDKENRYTHFTKDRYSPGELSYMSQRKFLIWLEKRKSQINLSNSAVPGILKTINSETYQEFQNEMSVCFEPWQYAEPYSIDFKDRFELDREAYLAYYFPKGYTGENQYDQIELLVRLIKNLESCKHPYLISYRKFLMNCHRSAIKDAEGGNELETPQHLADLFYNEKEFQDCIDILKKVEPPVLNSNGDFIGEVKGVFVIWVEKLRRQGFLKHHVSDRQFSILLSDYLKPFRISSSLFRKGTKRAKRLYELELNHQFSQLSQLSHRGK